MHVVTLYHADEIVSGALYTVLLRIHIEFDAVVVYAARRRTRHETE